MQPREFRHRSSGVLLAIVLAILFASPLRATAAGNPVLEWTVFTNEAVLAAGTGSVTATRVTAMVYAAMFDAINGIERRYEPIRVQSFPRRHTSERAAAIQAAYSILTRFYGTTQAATLNARRAASLNALGDSAQAIANGIAWGEKVAVAIWEWRSGDPDVPEDIGDGFNPNPPPAFRGNIQDGVWRPTPPLNLAGAAPNFATMEPWVLTRPSQFRPGPPPALGSEKYLDDLEEVRSMGETDSPRTADQSELAVFWTSNTPLAWNRIAAGIARERNLGLRQTARLFARLNLAMADAAIACWDSKYRYVYWRPVTAINAADPTWTPWLVNTPNHPEYLSGHSTVSGAAAHVLGKRFGDQTPFTIDFEAMGGSLADRSFPSFSAALAEIVDARVFGGIHFRTACLEGNKVGRAVADYVLKHAMRSRSNNWEDDGD